MNFLGVDSEAWTWRLPGGRAPGLLPFFALAWLAVLWRWRRSGWLLAGVLAAQAWVWTVTNYPLARLYALGPSRDRIGNVGLAQVVAAGNSPLHTTQVGQLHFEPFWGLLVAAASGWDPERLLRMYPFFSLVMALGFPLALYVGLRPAERDGDAWSGWERAPVAGFAVLLSSSARLHGRVPRAVGARSFLPKPNHALGLVLFPLFLYLPRSGSGPEGAGGCGLFLQLIGWAFVPHMVYAPVAWRFAALSAARGGPKPAATRPTSGDHRRQPARRQPVPGASARGIPVPRPAPPTTRPAPETRTRSSRRSRRACSSGSARGASWPGAEATGWAWGHPALGLAGAVGRPPALGAIHPARERDEIFLLAPFPHRRERGHRRQGPGRPPGPAAGRLPCAGGLGRRPSRCWLSFSIPYWWDPARMGRVLRRIRPPPPERCARRHGVPAPRDRPRAVVAGEPDPTRYGALGARRALVAGSMNAPRDGQHRGRCWSWRPGARTRAVRAALAPYGVDYLLVDRAPSPGTPGDPRRPGREAPPPAPRPSLGRSRGRFRGGLPARRRRGLRSALTGRGGAGKIVSRRERP